MLLVAAIGVDANGDKHPLGLVEGATENATTVQALIDNLVERGLDPTVRRLFIIDGAKALSKAIRRTFGRDAAIQRCQIHKARTFWSGCPNRCTLRCGASCGKPGKWTTPKRPKRSFAISPAVSNRTGTAFPLRSWKGSTRCSLSRGSASLANCAARSPAPTSSRMSWARCAVVCRNVKYWRSPSMALRWAAAAMQEATKGFRRLKAYKHLPALRAALAKQGQQPPSDEALVQIAEAA